MTAPQNLQQPLLADVRQLIDAARQRVAQAVNLHQSIELARQKLERSA